MDMNDIIGLIIADFIYDRLPALRLGSLKVRKSTLIDFVERYEGMDLSDLDNIKELQQNMN